MNAPLTGTARSQRLLPLLAATGLCLMLQACIDHKPPQAEEEEPGGGGDGGGGTTPTACSRLPTATTRYKGGDALGEELTLTLNPTTLAYTVSFDATLQRTVGSERSGTLVALDGCTYASGESGAVFTLAAGGVVQGGVSDAAGSGFVPLLAFATTFENTATPTVFNPVAAVYNNIGVQYAGGVAASYGGSGRIRNAGTFQLCQDAAAGFITYDAACALTAKGYLNYNTARGAFDVYTTPASGGAVTTDGTLSGSMVIGLVDGTAVPLQLVRASATAYGMRVYTTQTALVSGSADGSYVAVDSSGTNGSAVVAGAGMTRDGVSATLAYDAPVAGVAQASGGFAGNLLYAAGLYGFVPATAGGAAFELGVLR